MLPFTGGLTMQELPLLPPLTVLLLAPKNVLAELPMNIEDVGRLGVKVMLEGDAVKLDPSKVAVVPDPDDDNVHDRRVDDVTSQESQLSTMSPVTVVALIV
jgi:hypothetical protein